MLSSNSTGKQHSEMITRICGPISSDGSTTTIEQMKNLVKNTSKNLIAKVFSQENSIG